jgi:hypothetical protein
MAALNGCPAAWQAVRRKITPAMNNLDKWFVFILASFGYQILWM